MMNAFDRKIQRDYSVMPTQLRKFFIFERKWFGLITNILGFLALATMVVWIKFAIDQTWLVGGKKLLTENLNSLPYAWVTISICLGLVLTPKIFSISARYYYVKNRQLWKTT